MPESNALRLFKQIEDSSAGKTGEAFFKQITAALILALDAHGAFAGQLNLDRSVSMLAFRLGDSLQPNATYKLEGTPCDFVYRGEITAHGKDLCEVFPLDRPWFESMGVKSYLGVPLRHESGAVFGHLAVMDIRERDWNDADVDVMRLVALRGAAELERLAHERRLEDKNAELNREIARRTEVEKALVAARQSAEMANQAKSVFISNMSHELRTPLNGILGYTQLLAKESSVLTEAQREGLRIIERSGDHLLTLINDLLDLAKIEAGKVELKAEPIGLAQVLDDVSDLARIRAQKARQQFEYTAAANLPTIRGDARALRQILLNLLGNAVKFTPESGSIALKVRQIAHHSARCAFEFVIEDTGIGIAPDHLSSIFEPFHRIVDDSRRVEGTGLGLTITQRLVDAMGGNLAVSSELGRGSRFAVTLDFELDMQAIVPRRTREESTGYTGTRRRILVVEDDPTSQGLLVQLLQSLGFIVTPASDGEAAVNRLNAERIDLAITDLVMPKLNGIDFIRACRSQGLAKSIPIIALSASADATSRAALADAGCNIFLSKPVVIAELTHAIGQLLDIDWIVPQHEQPSATDAAVNLDTIDAAVLSQLRGFAQRGDIMSLMQCAESALASTAATQPLHRAISRLAASYDMQGIRKLLSDPVSSASAA